MRLSTFSAFRRDLEQYYSETWNVHCDDILEKWASAH
jgi:hypothetical protein